MENGYYHIYNRGVEKRAIFSDPQDYSVFLSYLKEYLSPKDEAALFEKLSEKSLSWKEKEKAQRLLRLNNFFGLIGLISFALMPNHFHLLIKQTESNNIDSLTRSLMTRYVVYFNRKNDRIGPLFQGVYKAVLVQTEEQLLHLSRYIHQNPLKLGGGARKHQELFTSLPEFLGKRKTEWVKPDDILSRFSKTNPNLSYHSFVEETEEIEPIQDLLLEDLD